MIHLPPGCSADKLEPLADWAEANALIDGLDVSTDDLIRSFVSGGLIGLEEAFDDDDDEIELGQDEARTEAAERLAQDVLAICTERAGRLGTAYPLKVEKGVLSSTSDSPGAAYLFLLLADLGLSYPPLKDFIEPDGHSGVLFEKVVEAALRGIFGMARRFGWPREPSWPTDINGRVAELAKELQLDIDSPELKTDPRDKDRTLDVAALMTMPRGTVATLAVLTQCAGGANWQSKRGEPSVAAWRDLLRWNCELVRAVALPWQLGNRRGDWSYTRAWQLFDSAMILDRPRLLAGLPDNHIDPAIVDQVLTWCQSASAELPRENSPE